MPTTIAVIFDFDDTLAPDSTSGYLDHIGEDVPKFWHESVDPLVKDGWDPVTAYIYRLIELSKSKPPGRRITRQTLTDFGDVIPYYTGVPDLFSNLKKEARLITKETKIDISLEFFIISSGLDEILQALSIRKHFTATWGNKLLYTGIDEEITFPKSIISFTDKTRYLFQISKGITGEEFAGRPFEVNKKLAPDNYAIPFTQMIFVGDGYTDVPCFSLVKKYGGIPLAVYDKKKRERWSRAWQFSEDNRVMQFASTDYRRSSDLYSLLVMSIERIATGIAIEGRASP